MELSPVSNNNFSTITSKSGSTRVPVSKWPNKSTVSLSVALASNIATQIWGTAVPAVLVLNLPVRAYRVYMNLSEKKFPQTILDIAAFSLLAFPPYGPLGAIAVDLGSEGINYYRQRFPAVPLQAEDGEDSGPPLVTREFNPQQPTDSLKILGISNEHAQDIEYITNVHKKLTEKINEKIPKASPLIAQEFRNQIQRFDVALETLKIAQEDSHNSGV